MSLLSNPFDDPAAVRARAEQGDPLVMYLVINRVAAAEVDFPTLACTLARTVVTCSEQFTNHPQWSANFTAWYRDSFRKVTLDANPRDWPKLLAESGEDLVLAENLVAVLPPRPRSTNSALLRGIQTYKSPLPVFEAATWVETTLPQVLLAINPDLEMTAGKALAQIGHAALMVGEVGEMEGGGSWLTSLAAWSGADFRLVKPTNTGWRQALAEIPAIVVTDSGLTETTPGSQTVLATQPASGKTLRAYRDLLTTA
jgi:peptidyl-tRNA hydrolase